MKYIWISDTHFDFVIGKVKTFGEYLAKDYPDALGLIHTGDISNGLNLIKDLLALAEGFGKPIYFALGNHDFYRSSIARVESRLNDLDNPLLYWLDKGNVVLPGGTTTLVGNSNWYDCRYGSMHSSIELNDFHLIEDFKNLRNKDRQFQMDSAAKYADKQARKLKLLLDKVDTENVIISVHVPPYNHAAWHQGHLCDNDWLPWMSSQVTGETILDYHEKNPERKITVTTGHTHSSGFFKIDDNLVVYTGKAKYGFPEECGTIEIDDYVKVIPK